MNASPETKQQIWDKLVDCIDKSDENQTKSHFPDDDFWNPIFVLLRDEATEEEMKAIRQLIQESKENIAPLSRKKAIAKLIGTAVTSAAIASGLYVLIIFLRGFII